jgi:hypothetical protein
MVLAASTFVIHTSSDDAIRRGPCLRINTLVLFLDLSFRSPWLTILRRPTTASSLATVELLLPEKKILAAGLTRSLNFELVSLVPATEIADVA